MCLHRKERTVKLADDPSVPTPADDARSSRKFTDIAVDLCTEIGRLGLSQRGDLAQLRRMDPFRSRPAVFWRLMAANDIEGSSDWELRWALIVHGIAMTTPKAGGEATLCNAHNGAMPFGKALFLGNESSNERAFISETRLNRLLVARGRVMQSMLARLFRHAARSGVTFNWREPATLILREGRDNVRAERMRSRIARDYFATQRSRTQV